MVYLVVTIGWEQKRSQGVEDLLMSCNSLAGIFFPLFCEGLSLLSEHGAVKEEQKILSKKV